MKNAQACPLCSGDGVRPLYTDGTGTEVCRACSGQGWVYRLLPPSLSVEPSSSPKLSRPFRGRHP